jgi:hypothetical protein
MLSAKSKRGFTAAVLTILAFTTVIVTNDELESLKEAFKLRGRSHRQMSIHLGGGKCEWTAPLRTPLANVDFHKTLVAGFPSG